MNNEHLTEALRRLRKNSSDNNVDRRLVTNILLSFLTTRRADSKRFEMLSLLATILSWNDAEREKAGLQRVGASGTPGKGGDKGKGKGKQNERSAEEEAAMNEVSFDLESRCGGYTDGPSPLATSSSSSCSKRRLKVNLDQHPARLTPLPPYNHLLQWSTRYCLSPLQGLMGQIHPCGLGDTRIARTFQEVMVRDLYQHTGGKAVGVCNKPYRATRWIGNEKLRIIVWDREVERRVKRKMIYHLACNTTMCEKRHMNEQFCMFRTQCACGHLSIRRVSPLPSFSDNELFPNEGKRLLRLVSSLLGSFD